MSFKMKRTIEMRRVESAFADYLENEGSVDLLWSDKVGYVTAAASVTVIQQTKPNAVTIARHCKSFLPTLNPECVKWPVRCRCTAEKETDSIGQEK